MSEETPVIPPGMDTTKPAVLASRSAARRYAAGVALFLFALCGGMLALTTTRWYPLHNGDPGLRNIGYSLRAAGANCEIVIYGDSTSLTGMDPAVFEKMTGLKTCNVSEGATIQSVVGSDAPLQFYLAHNKAPRFLLTMWAAVDFEPDRAPGVDLYPEGMTYAMQFENNWPTWKMLLKKGYWLPNFAATSLYGVVHTFFESLATHAKPFDAVAYRDERQGWYPYPRPPETGCVRSALPIKDSDVHRYEASVAAFRRKYTTPQTRVIVNISAMPTCDAHLALYERLAHGLYDNKFEVLPIGYFNEGDVHFTPQGADLISAHAAQQILDLMHEPSAQQGASSR